MDAALPVVGSIAAVVITALLAPWFARRAAARESERQKAEDNERRANSAESREIQRLFTRQDQLADQYQRDNADLRNRLFDAEKKIRELEVEVAEWRAGVHGVQGVWIAVPASVWTYVRDRLPELPQNRFPGEADGDLPPAAI